MFTTTQLQAHGSYKAISGGEIAEEKGKQTGEMQDIVCSEIGERKEGEVGKGDESRNDKRRQI